MEGEKTVIYLPWLIMAYMITGTVVGIAVSLFTKPISKKKLDRVYNLTRTPVRPGEGLTDSCQPPEGVEPAQRAMLLTAGTLEIPKLSGVSLAGFIGGQVVVGLMITGFVLLWW